MTQKTIKSRFVQKHDLEAHWLLATNFIPMQGEFIVYDAEIDADGNILALPEDRTEPYTYARLKLGDGINNVNDLPFIRGEGSSGGSETDLDIDYEEVFSFDTSEIIDEITTSSHLNYAVLG